MQPGRRNFALPYFLPSHLPCSRSRRRRSVESRSWARALTSCDPAGDELRTGGHYVPGIDSAELGRLCPLRPSTRLEGPDSTFAMDAPTPETRVSA
jgi:hypothetical protein